MIERVLTLILAVAAAGIITAAEPDAVRPESFGFVDSLGRTWLPPRSKAAKADKPRFVAMFYWTWHGSFAESLPPRNVSEVLAAHPEAVNDFNHPAWNDTPATRTYFWGKPLFGFKWADGNAVNGDIADFYLHGDAAPGGRFRYLFAP